MVHVYGVEESDVELFPASAAEHADIVVIDQHLARRGTPPDEKRLEARHKESFFYSPSKMK